ncbi:MAG: DUF5674 family protein [Candidatus Doudnabacteria bacterium]|nr:DUF5674 family protein [bacterium]MDZ4243793.1 DUF5674 family protein [Candidatus Doudnabacteria bacterium]
MEIRIIREKVSTDELKKMTEESFLDFVKAVVDVKRGLLALGGELHSDAEALLLQDSSNQQDLWGINIFPEKPEQERIEFTSLINIRPREGNKSMEVQSEEIRRKIKEIVNRLVV